MSILNKKRKDLTPEDIRNHKRVIASPEFPMPVKEIVEIKKEDGTTTHTEVWGVLDDDTTSPYVLSDRTQDEVTGMVFREMPAPSHSRYALEMVRNAQPDGENRILYFKGTRGGGKTYAIEWLGRMMSEDGTDVINCGNADLSNLVFETVLDSGGTSVFDFLDRKVRNNELNPLTLKELALVVGEDVITENGIDWEKVAQKENKKGVLLNEVLQLAKHEGFGIGGNSLGISQRKGRFVENLEKGRPTLLDEYPRHKPGSDAGFHRLFEFVAGLIPDYYDQSSLAQKGDRAGSIINLKDEDRKVGSFLMLSGNTEADGDDVHELPESVYSRVDVKYFTDLNVEDWQARWCHTLTGVPLSSHYFGQQDKWDEDPEAFAEYLKEGRVIGLSEEKVNHIPEHQFDLLDRWQDTLKASRILAEFCHEWARMLTEASAGVNFAELMMEVDDVFKKEMSMDPRKIKRFFDQSANPFPEARLDNATRSIIVDMDKGLKGTRGYHLVKGMMDFAFSTTEKIGKSALHGKLVDLADMLELRQVAELLNNNPYQNVNAKLQNGFRKELLISTYVEKGGELSPQQADDLLDNSIVSYALNQAMRKAKGDAALIDDEGDEIDVNVEHTFMTDVSNSASPSVIIINEDVEDLLEEPFENVHSIDKALLLQGSASEVDITKLGPSVEYESFMRSLLLPQLRKQNLEQLWDMSLTESGTYSSDFVDSPALVAAQSLESAGMVITSVQMKASGNGSTTLHVIRNVENGKTVLVGDSLSPELSAHFDKARLNFVDKTAQNAAELVDSAVSQITDSTDAQVIRTLKQAFLLRNHVEGLDGNRLKASSLGDLICHKELDTFMPRLLLKERQHQEPAL